MNDNQLLNNYLTNQIQNVEGWCFPHLWQLIQPIDQWQRSINLQKPIAEIGVYHGKFFIGLALTKNSHGKHHAFDVFDMQEFNLDGAGNGNLSIFKSNLAKFKLGGDATQIVRSDSMAISQAELIKYKEESKGFSMFSIDGCHLPEHTINDFKIAIELTCTEGIIFIDDYTNVDWPGVAEGIAKFYFNEYPKFVPLAVICNKLIVCHISYHAILIKIITEFISKNHPTTRIKNVIRFGYSCINIHPEYSKDNYLA